MGPAAGSGHNFLRHGPPPRQQPPLFPHDEGLPILRTLAAATLAALTLTALAPSAAKADATPVIGVTLGQPSHGTVALNGSSEVTGAVAGLPLGGRRVDLQLKTPTGWFSVEHTTTDLTGGFRFAVPTWWYGAHTWRALAAATVTLASATSEARTVTVKTPATTGKATAYTRMPGNARWHACKPIPFYLNPAGAPAGALANIRFALRQITAGSGIRFVYRGHTKVVPWSSQPRQGMPVSGLAYAFTTPRMVHQLAGSTVGLGGSSYTISSKGNWYNRGGIAIDRGFHAGRKLLRNVLMHESGHAVGLDHVTDRREVMYPTANGYDSWGRGDLAGLAKVGISQGC